MQAVQTKYLPATDTRGSRIKVKSWLGAKTYPYDHSAECAHEAAFKQWLDGVTASRIKAGYAGTEPFCKVVAKGNNPNNSGYSFIVQ